MTQLATSDDTYRAAFEQLPAGGAPWLGALRARGFERFSANGFPTTRLEAWRFTNVAPLARGRFTPPETSVPTPAALEPYRLSAVEGPRVVVVDGRFAPDLSDLGSLPDGVEIAGLADLLASDPASVEPYLGALAGIDRPAEAFAALNTGLLTDGVVIRVARGVAAPVPVQVLFASSGAAGTMTHPRLLVVADEQSQLGLVESYATLTDGASLTNAVTEVHVADSAIVDHYKLLRESTSAFHVAGLHVRTGRASRFSSHGLTLGAAISRNDIVAEMRGEGGECTLNGLYLVNGSRLADTHTTIHHAMPHCDSHELYKGILDDEARAVFNGKIVVAIDAQKTDAKQTNKALLLSEDAQINTKPELEIFADDVRCTHGATIGQLDDDALFYLRSRGLGVEQARDVLIHAFASDLLNRISIPAIRDQLDAVLLKQLPGSGHAPFVVS